MSVKKSVEKVKDTRDKFRNDIEETRKVMRELRPHPFRRAVDKRMTDIRPLKRLRKRIASARTESISKGSDQTGQDSS